MNNLLLFAGWGPCGPLNSAGTTEFYFFETILQLAALAISGIIIAIAHSRFVTRFNKNKSPKPVYLILSAIGMAITLFVVYSPLKVLADFIFGDANLGGYAGATPCDPIDLGIVLQASGIIAIALVLIYWQISRYLHDRRKKVSPRRNQNLKVTNKKPIQLKVTWQEHFFTFQKPSQGTLELKGSAIVFTGKDSEANIKFH
jgi:membrane protein implicated in regulation of membrane protease activity